MSVTLKDVQEAAQRIVGEVVRTPCLRSETLSRIARADIWIKFENLQFTASFKERGALNTLLQLTPEERKRGVIAMSAGNHAQGVAYHAGRLGIPATIVMPAFTPNTKVTHTKGHGAKVVLHGNTLAEAATEAHRLADADKLVFVHPYDDPRIIAGQGTIALEMLPGALIALLVGFSTIYHVSLSSPHVVSRRAVGGVAVGHDTQFSCDGIHIERSAVGQPQ